ncbi:MAG: TspO/MBR family protein [Salinibacter sp.]
MVDDWRGTLTLLGKALGAILVCEAVGLVAGWATQTSVTTWYPTLTKPSFTPPNWLFAPVWTLLYALMGLAAFLVWRRGLQRVRVRSALTAFGVQLVLNAGWSFAFFGARSPALGLVVILFLWGTLAWTMDRFFRLQPTAGWLLVPYLAWVTYALALNGAIWVLN